MDKKKIGLIVEIVLFVVALCAITGAYFFTGNVKKLEEESNSVGIIKVYDDNFAEEVENSKLPIILEYSSNNCPPCITMIPTMINIAKNNKDIKVVTVNLDDDNTKEIRKKYEVEASPTFYIIKDGEILDKIVGATTEEALLKELK